MIPLFGALFPCLRGDWCEITHFSGLEDGCLLFGVVVPVLHLI